MAPDPDPHMKIQDKIGIRIQIQCIWIHNTAGNRLSIFSISPSDLMMGWGLSSSTSNALCRGSNSAPGTVARARSYRQYKIINIFKKYLHLL